MSEYAAVVTRMPETYELSGCDNVRGARFFGLQAIVSKDTVPGTLGVLFVTESQLSPEYLSENNLYRHSDLNKDPDSKGYFEDNGRVRAVKFRGHRSDCFWMPLDSLAYLWPSWQGVENLREGDSFEELGGHHICKKYVVKTKGPSSQQVKRNTRVSERYFPQHNDTSNFFRNVDKIPWDAHVVVTQKLHGTSVRIGNVSVARELSFIERVARKFGLKIQEKEFIPVAGSRRVTKDPARPGVNFYNTDIHSLVAQEVLSTGVVPEGYVLYGEIIGWTPDGAPIQKGYTYQIPPGEHRLYIYRVSHINTQGIAVDLSWAQLKEFCDDRRLKYVPELNEFNGSLEVDNLESYINSFYIDKKLAVSWDQCLPLEPSNPSDEGVCIRVEGWTPTIYKAKSPMFLAHETKMLDEAVEDMEASDA